MAALPVRPFVLPTDLAHVPHGVIDKSVHVPVLIPGSGTSWMHHLAARGLAVLTARCKAETGVTLGSIGMWRTLAVEEAGFKRSYLDHYDPTLCTLDNQRQYQGKTWYLLKNTIPKATPGTSKHGKGLADDLAIWNGKSKLGIRSSAKAWSWLKANVVECGFSWAYAKEGVDDPHIQWFGGDVMPRAVLDFEAAHGLTPIVPQPPDIVAPGALPAVPPPTIMAGDRGADVTALQKHLAALGLYLLKIDGQCGQRTVQAIRDLQTKLKQAGLYTGKVDGVFGPMTRTSYMAWDGRPR